MTTLTEQAGALAEELDSKREHANHCVTRAANLLRQIAALGDGEGLTVEQTDTIADSVGVEEYNTRLADAFIDAATLPYKAIIADHNRLVRELDIALNGEAGAALQARLCDLVSQLLAMKARISELQKDKADLEAYIDLADDDRTKLQEQLAASQARERKLRSWSHVAHAIRTMQVWYEEGREMIPQEAGQYDKQVTLCQNILLQIDGWVGVRRCPSQDQPSDLTALHADRMATIERVRGIVEQINADFAEDRLYYDGRGKGGALYATNLACGQLTEAAKRAERGEAI